MYAPLILFSFPLFRRPAQSKKKKQGEGNSRGSNRDCYTMDLSCPLFLDGQGCDDV